MPHSTLDQTVLVERLREVAGSNRGHAVQIMRPPSYLQTLFYNGCSGYKSGLTPDIVLIYKVRNNPSTSSLPLDVRDESNLSLDTFSELDGNPLPAPFENDEFEVSATEWKEQFQWPKGEVNHHPLKIGDALSILNEDVDFGVTLDVWCLVDGGINTEPQDATSDGRNDSLNGSQLVNDLSMQEVDVPKNDALKTNEKKRILLGLHATENWWTRSYVESKGLCSLASPEMDPNLMTKDHLEIAQMSKDKMNCSVFCRYTIQGERISSDALVSDSGSSVSLELRWKHPSINVPSDILQGSSSEVLVQAVVGHKSSLAHNLWKQLCVLQSLFESLLNCWSSKTSPNLLPHVVTPQDLVLEESLQSRIGTLILGGKHALQAQKVNHRMSIAPALQGRQSIAPGVNGRQSIAPGFLGRRSIAPKAMTETGEKNIKQVSLSEALEIATAGLRENSDVTDGLFGLLIECKTYQELVSAWGLTFMKLNDGKKPYIRPKNSTRVAKLIKGFVSGQLDSSPDFLQIEGSLQALELLIEVGLEKLMTDYYYIFLDSQLVRCDELKPPELIRASLGVSRDRWLASCGQLLGWLAQVHSALEVILPLQCVLPENSVPDMASKALKHYQSKSSPVRSVDGVVSPRNSLQEFRVDVRSHVVHEINKSMDWWRMTLTSECETRKVKSVFLRSYLRPIFPPQLCKNCEALVPIEGVENEQYFCAEAVTISSKF